jgi:hypothetical protein
MTRPAMREESESGRPPVRARRRRSNEDKFAVPSEYRTPGVSYEWKKESCLGEEDPMYMSSLIENGWVNVQLEEMPAFGRTGETGAVRRGGQVLMKRPIELTKEARIEDWQAARSQVKGNVSKMTGADAIEGMPNRGNKVQVNYDQMPADARMFKSATTQIELDD